jgi:hypothetical protein
MQWALGLLIELEFVSEVINFWNVVFSSEYVTMNEVQRPSNTNTNANITTDTTAIIRIL